MAPSPKKRLSFAAHTLKMDIETFKGGLRVIKEFHDNM